MKTKNVLYFVLSQIDRKPVKDTEARSKFKEAIWDYIADLESLEVINVLPTSPAFEQKSYLNKLLVIANRWDTIGDEVLPDGMLDTFLSKLQDMCREYLHQDLSNEFYTLRKKHYYSLAFTQQSTEIPAPTLLRNLKEEAFRNIRNNNLG
jgi:hypothetical protein